MFTYTKFHYYSWWVGRWEKRRTWEVEDLNFIPQFPHVRELYDNPNQYIDTRSEFIKNLERKYHHFVDYNWIKPSLSNYDMNTDNWNYTFDLILYFFKISTQIIASLYIYILSTYGEVSSDFFIIIFHYLGIYFGPFLENWSWALESINFDLGIKAWFASHDNPIKDYVTISYFSLKNQIASTTSYFWGPVFVAFALMYILFHYIIIHFLFFMIYSILKFSFFFFMRNIYAFYKGYVTKRSLTYKFLIVPYIRWLQERSIIRYAWIKYEIYFERLVRYPTTIIIHYLIVSSWDYIVSAPNSYVNFLHDAKLNNVVWEGQETSIITKPVELGLSIEVVLSIIMIYHIYFWMSLIFKRWVYYTDKYFSLILASYYIVFKSSLFPYCYGFVILYLSIEITWANHYIYVLLIFFQQGYSILINEESEWLYDIIHEPDNWRVTLWNEHRLFTECERYYDLNGIDLNWEYRENKYLSELKGYSLKHANLKYMQHVKIEREKAIKKKRFQEYNFQDWKWMLERKSRGQELLNKERQINYTTSWEKLMLHNNPFGNYDLNQFSLLGFLPMLHKFMYTYVFTEDMKKWKIFKLIFPKYISLPWENGLYFRFRLFGYTVLNIQIPFTIDFIEFSLTPWYMFIKNPKWTFLNYEQPYQLKNWSDLSDRGVESGITFDVLHDVDLETYKLIIADDPVNHLFKVYEKAFDSYHMHRVSLILTDNGYGSRKMFFNGNRVVWDSLVYARPRGFFTHFRFKLYKWWNLNYSDRRKIFRKNFFSIFSFYQRYTILEHIFFRKRIKRIEHQLLVEMEELAKHRISRTGGVDRRLLTSYHRKRYH